MRISPWFSCFIGMLVLSGMVFAQPSERGSRGNRDRQNQRGPAGPGMGQRPEFRDAFADLRGEDGSMKLDALLEKVTSELKAADKDNDGTLTAEELRASDVGRLFSRGPMGFGGGPMAGGPGMMGMGGFDMFRDAKNDKDEIVLEKLSDRLPPQMKEALTNADKNKDGVLSKKEQKDVPFLNNPRGNQPGMMGMMGGPGFDPMARLKGEDGRIDLSKLPEQFPEPMVQALKDADADKDGFLSEEEQKEIKMPGPPQRGPAPNADAPEKAKKPSKKDR